MKSHPPAFWPGGGGTDFAAFYSYAYPTPNGFADEQILPTGALFRSEARGISPGLRRCAEDRAIRRRRLCRFWKAPIGRQPMSDAGIVLRSNVRLVTPFGPARQEEKFDEPSWSGRAPRDVEPLRRAGGSSCGYSLTIGHRRRAA